MTESRDRLVRPVDLGAAFSRIRDGAIVDGPDLAPPLGTGWDRVGFGWRNFGTPRNGVGRGRTAMGVLTSEGGETPLTPLVGSGRGMASSIRGRFRTPTTVIRRGRNLYASPVVAQRQSSSLPSWYPRRPLRDVSHVVRALERRRTRLGETEPHQNDRDGEGPPDTPLPQQRAPMENYMPHDTPSSSSRKNPCPPSMLKVTKIIQSAANKPSNGDSECLTPQKKLLAEIGTVEKLVMEELNKLKRTSSAKKAAREKRVRTLLSMR